MFAKNNRSTLFLLLFIVVIASLFRLTSMDIVEFKTDEAVNMLLPLRFILGHGLPSGGTVSSVGILNPPLFNYFLIPILLISRNPMTLSFVIALVNVISIGLFFLFIKKYYSTAIALIASLLLSLSPWAILFSRKIWTQDILLPFSVLLFYSLHKIIYDREKGYWFLFSFSSLLLMQLHQASIFFTAPLFLFLLIKRVKVDWKMFLLGILIGLLPLIPYVVWELQNKCPDCQAFIMIRQRLSVGRSLLLFARPLQILSQGDFYQIVGSDMQRFANDFPWAYKLRSIFYLEYILLPLGIIFYIRRFPKLAFLAFATILLPILYYVFKIEPFIHYFIIIAPLLFLFLAISFSSLLNYNKITRIISLSIFLAIIAESFYFNFGIFSLLQQRKSLAGDYGDSLAITYPATQQKLAKYKNRQEFQEIVLSEYIPLSYMYGYQPLSKMLYPEKSPARLQLLDKRLEADPDDPRVSQEIIGYYTATPPTSETIDLLREKSQQIKAYKPFYDNIYGVYLQQHYRNTYTTTGFGFTFEYPEHWKIEEINRELVINADGYFMSFYRINGNEDIASLIDKNEKNTYNTTKVNIKKQVTDKTICMGGNNIWCGTWYYPIMISNSTYLIHYGLLNKNRFVDKNSEELYSRVSAMDEVLNSIRQ